MKVKHFSIFGKALTAAVFFICIIPGVEAQVSPLSRNAAVLDKDIFHTAVFLENRDVLINNTGEKILYYTAHDNINAFYTAAGTLYKVCHTVNPLDGMDTVLKALHMKTEEDEPEGLGIAGTLVQAKWIGSNPYVQITGSTKSEGYYSYVKQVGTQLKPVVTEGYRSITYNGLYPGIDVVYSFPDKGGVEYNLVLHPGADVSKIKYSYSGKDVFVRKDSLGNLIIQTPNGRLIEHAPVSFCENGTKVATQFIINGNEVSFSIAGNYDNKTTLTIDPWVTALTQLPADNLGMDVDYDFNGNLYVYGAGPTDDQDFSNQFQVAKYSSAGSFLWDFAGTVPSINWTTSVDSSGVEFYDLPSNFSVDKSTGKTYVGQALGGNDTTTVIRLSAAGVYDNFHSLPDTSFRECWGLIYNCGASSMLAMGGGVTSNINMGVINTTSGAMAFSNITGIANFTDQDIVCATYDSAGNLYVIMNDILKTDYLEPALPFDNTIYKVNTAFNGNVWGVTSHYTVFNEVNNDNFWEAPNNASVGGNGNWYNCLAANGQFLFYYDGQHVAAYNLATGARVGSTTVATTNVLKQAGIAVDNCNNVYVGGKGLIYTFSFNGTTFTPTASITLAGVTGAVIDIKYRAITNLLYVTGKDFVATVTAALSTTCSVISSYTLATSATCNTATVHISPTAFLNPKVFNIIWTNSAGTVVSQLNNTTDTINTVTGLSNGTYYVNVQWHPNCDGRDVIDSVVIACDTPQLTISPDTTICNGQPVLLTAVGTPVGGAYLWAPGGATTASITVTPATSTTYTCTYAPLTGAPITDTTRVTVSNSAVTVSVNNAAACSGNSATLTATPSVGGGTYLWAPGGATTQSITVAPGTTTTYTVTYAVGCGTATNIGTVTVGTNPTITLSQNVTCSSGNNVIYITASTGTAPYQYEVNNSGYQAADSFTNLVTGTDSVHVKDAKGCAVSGVITLVTVNGSGITVTQSPASCAGGDGQILATTTSGTAPFQFNLNGGAYQASNSFTGLNTGFYTVGVKDANGCANTDTISVTTSNPVTLSLAMTSVGCAGNNGTITATGANGAAPYQYSINGGAFQASGSFTGLSAGFYTVQTEDANTCAATDTITVTTQPSPTTLSLTMTPVSCAGNNGTITATAANGAAPYQYSLNGGAYQASGSFTGLSTGFFTVQTTDANSCAATDTITVTPQPNTTTLNLTMTPVSCAGSDGTITATGRGGTAPYQYTLNGGASQTTNVFTSLNTGFYTVQVTDAQSCTVTDTITVTTSNPQRLAVTVVNPLCFGDSGSITATGSGGATPYQYAINGGAYQASGTFSGLTGGTYTITTQDVNTCTASATATVNPAPALVTLSPVVTPDSCPGYSDGTISAPATGGTSPYTYAWSNSAPNNDLNSGLPKGNYSVTATDANGCSASATAAIIELPGIEYTATAHNVFCVPLHNGSIEVDVNAGSLPVSYLWSNGQQTPSVYMLNQGNYSVTITNAAGCRVDTSFIIGNDSAFSLTVFPTDTTIQLGNAAAISAIPHGDGISFMYWDPSEYVQCDTCASTSASPIQTLLYHVSVLSDSGCTAVDSILINVIPFYNIFIPNVFTPNGDGNNDNFQVFGEKSDWKEFSIMIFDRWGEKVYESEDMNFAWDGMYKGKPLPMQVLVYEVHLTYLNNVTAKLFKGSVTLVR